VNYKYLLKPGRIGSLRIRNRSVMTSAGLGLAELNGEANDRLVSFYEERAAGGIGMIIVEGGCFDAPYGFSVPNQLYFTDEKYIRGLERITEAVHKYDTRIIAQLVHLGCVGRSDLTGVQNVSASDIPTIPSRIPRPLKKEEIRELVDKFAKAARLSQVAGFDGVEIHAAHGYLFAQFLSEYYNRRDDEYGGSFENRMRFVDEVIQATRDACGNDFAIILRISGSEFASHISDLCMTLDDGVAIAKYFEQRGIDALNVSVANGFTIEKNCEPYSYEVGWKKHVAQAIKSAVKIPVIATNTIKTPAEAEQMLSEKSGDYVGLCRSQFADPEFMNKAIQGREKEIRTCIGCLFCRESIVAMGSPVRCAVNPRTCCESYYPSPPKDGNNRPVSVIGAGPAGLQAAITLAERGFKVTVYEKDSKPGGTLKLAGKPPYKDKIIRLVDTLYYLAQKAGVSFRLGCEATPELVQQLRPVGVFLCTGAEPIVPKLPGVDFDNVITAEQFLAQNKKLNGRVAVVGTGLTGLETAEILGQQGCSLVLVEMQNQLAPGLFYMIRDGIIARLDVFKPEIYTGHRLTQITDDSVILQSADVELKVPVDWIVLALGVRPRKELAESFYSNFDNVMIVGDAAKSGRIYHAIKDAYIKAYGFEPTVLKNNE
jgi:2,4-dienoyl-CoA reductase-like NADH-dependent reductase (Old Yellow Enzyme family)/thioredoxin reductase